MSFSVAALKRQINTVTVQVGADPNDTIEVQYRPAAITPALEAKLSDLQEDPQRGRTFCEQFGNLVAEWDLMTDDSPEATPYPLDAASLYELGYPVLLNVITDIMADYQPSKRGGGATPSVAKNRRER
jgi:hypothetical protein